MLSASVAERESVRLSVCFVRSGDRRSEEFLLSSSIMSVRTKLPQIGQKSGECQGSGSCLVLPQLKVSICHAASYLKVVDFKALIIMTRKLCSFSIVNNE